MQTPPQAEEGSNSVMSHVPGRACVLGIDMGTTSVKVALVEETDQGPAVIKSCTKETQAQVEGQSGPQGDEQDVKKIVAALNECLEALPQHCLQRVCRIGISGQMHGIVFWKAGRGCKWTGSGTGQRFEPQEVSCLITWQDGRCSSSFLSSLPPPRSHLSVATGFGCATVYWYLRNSPDFLKRYDVAGTIHDYVVTMLCGQEQPRMSVQNAASWGYFNTTQKTWNMDILGESQFPLHLLPKVVEPGDLAGETSCTWHAIPKGTEVGVALGDCQCSVYSCMPQSTDAVLNFGTSAQLTMQAPFGFQPGDSPDPCSPVAYFPYFGNRYLAVAASLNGGNVLATFVDMLAEWMAELGLEVPHSVLFPRAIQAALAQADTALSIRPTVFGERHVPEQRGSVTDIVASDLSLGHVTRALCRGVVQNLNSMLPSERLLEMGAKRILASGSALSRNEVLRQEVEKMYPFPVVYGKDMDAAVGAALVMLHRQ
ncbi:sedoheptulokinase [Eublepharis macularius]|uniref:Sedoheptulokinase n=1 Tax=Eublepharis macularius TaxID=481883 RepID=A0AA97LJA5_EUBMA|nr:sedoheptulokinase [Eublepharis macularius]XP_054857581.1 sedoheptulokinase [Eublepharis macularius]